MLDVQPIYSVDAALARLQPAWAALTQRLGLDLCCDDLLRRWQQPQRRFHTPQHLAEVLAVLSNASPLLQLAAWYHDAVYWPAAADNEAQSAQLAAEQLAEARLPAASISTVCRAIEATAQHLQAPGWVQPLMDADLWILASPAPRYAQYREQLAAEYGNMPAAQFAAGRRQLLQQWLAAPQLFSCTELDARARRNLQAELDECRL